MRVKVLTIDDEEGIRSSLKMLFEYEGYDVVLAANGEAGLKIATSRFRENDEGHHLCRR